MASRIGFVAFAGAMIVAGTAGAAGETSTAEARLAWATRHVELVCQPLEAKQMFDKATRCYNDVARIVAQAAKAEPAKSAVAKPAAAKPSAAKTIAVAKPAVAKPAVAATASPAAQPAGLRPATRSAARRIPATRVAAAPRRPAPVVAIESRTAAVEPASALPNGRCQGMSCLKRYTLLGVGF